MVWQLYIYLVVHWTVIIIIISYFENLVFFHAKIGSDVCPRVDNQTSGDTLQNLTWPLSGKISISQLSTHGFVIIYKSKYLNFLVSFSLASFWWHDVLPYQPVRIREETLESGNLFSSSWISVEYLYVCDGLNMLNMFLSIRI